MNALDTLIEANRPFLRKLDAEEFRLITFSNFKGYPSFDGVVNCWGIEYALDVARNDLPQLSFRTEWLIMNHLDIKVAQSVGLVEMLGIKS